MTQKIKLKDYSAPVFTTEHVNLCFQLFEDHTLVSSMFTVSKRSNDQKLFLHGENLELIQVSLDSKILNSDEYEINDHGLIITIENDQANIEIKNKIYPHKNLALEGLYKSGTIFCTQNEPEGFRKITYFFDRSDVLCKFTTTIEADKAKYPYLLANGNKISAKNIEGGRHQVVWEDPFNKATYLFALVAGDLAKITDSFTTKSGRNVAIEFFVDFGNEKKCAHAILSLKNAMKWDEETFNREYDLDIYMVVAVDSFNMGAMENKGLNIFNSSCVLARFDMATDYDFCRIESVVAHEYFHNWSGNRVTLRNWFELTLKEGLTVFRDQEFSSDMLDAAVQRISDVKDLKRSQFVEDAGPMSHPIKPKEYEEINNFYTATVYNKGAEVIRMIQTILGKSSFKKSMDLYFDRFDGKAVTTDDFLKAMEDGSGIDLTLFKNWYDTQGTPKVTVKTVYNEKDQSFKVNLEQNTQQYLLHIPLGMGLITNEGEISLNHDKIDKGIFHFKQKNEEIIFKNISTKPVLSINRHFTSPVYIDQNLSLTDYKLLAENDTDLFNKAEAFKNLMKKNIFEMNKNSESEIYQEVLEIIKINIKDIENENFLAAFLDIPSEVELNQELEIADYSGIHSARERFIKKIATHFEDEFLTIIEKLNDSLKVFEVNAKEIGKRSLKNRLLSFLSRFENQKYLDLILSHFNKASNMTDEYSTLLMLGYFNDPKVKNARDRFIKKWEKESLVIDKWLSAIAISDSPNTLNEIKNLERHPLYNKTNPNKFRALLGSFCVNFPHFHHESGRGYQYIADKIIEMDKINPQTASRLLINFSQVNRLNKDLKSLMKNELKRINAQSVSNDVKEISGKYLS